MANRTLSIPGVICQWTTPGGILSAATNVWFSPVAMFSTTRALSDWKTYSPSSPCHRTERELARNWLATTVLLKARRRVPLPMGWRGWRGGWIAIAPGPTSRERNKAAVFMITAGRRGKDRSESGPIKGATKRRRRRRP